MRGENQKGKNGAQYYGVVLGPRQMSGIREIIKLQKLHTHD